MSVEVRFKTIQSNPQLEMAQGHMPSLPEQQAGVDPATLPAELRREAIFMLYTPDRSMLQLAREIAPGHIMKEVAEASDVYDSERTSDQRMPASLYKEGEDRPRKPHPVDPESVAVARAAAGTMDIIYAIAYDKPDSLMHGVQHLLAADATLGTLDSIRVYNAHRLTEAAALLGDYELYKEAFLTLQDMKAMNDKDLQDLIWSRWEEYRDIRDRWQTKGPKMLPDPPEELITCGYDDTATYRWENTEPGQRYDSAPHLASLTVDATLSREHTADVVAKWRLEELRDASEALGAHTLLMSHVENKDLTGTDEHRQGTYRPPHEHMYDQPQPTDSGKVERYVAASALNITPPTAA